MGMSYITHKQHKCRLVITSQFVSLVSVQLGAWEKNIAMLRKEAWHLVKEYKLQFKELYLRNVITIFEKQHIRKKVAQVKFDTSMFNLKLLKT